MAFKNKRTSVAKPNAVEERLKKQLKEEYGMSLQEDGEDDLADDTTDELPTDGQEDDMGLPTDDTNTTGGLGGGGVEDIAGTETDEEDSELDPNQEQWIDDEVDNLITSNYGDGTEEEHTDFSLDEDEGDDLGDLSADGVEDDLDTLGDEASGGGTKQVSRGDDVFSAKELNSYIDSPDTIHDIDDALVNKATTMPTDELDTELDNFSQFGSFKGGSEDGGLGMGDEGGNDFDEDEEFFGEGDGFDGAKSNYKKAGNPMSAIKGQDKGNFDQGYEGEERKDDLFEVEGLPDGFEETDSETEGEFTKAKDGKAKAKKIETEPHFDTVKESIKKSRMLVLAAESIARLQEGYKKLKFQNEKLKKVNGILYAVGDRLTKETKKQLAEKFSKCKTDAEVKSLYEKVVKIVKEKNQKTLNEAVKPVTKKSVINESTKKVSAVSQDQERKNYLMGIPGNDNGYFNF